MLKVDLPKSVGIRCTFFNEVWERDEMPEDWRKDLIVKIPKKGDVSVCVNSHGITLLSIPSKVFCRVILNRIRMAVDQRIREEHAGIRADRGRSDQIFEVQTGVRQGCMLSLLLFLILIDYVVRIANERSRSGIQWGISSGRVEYLDDLEYADDMTVLPCTHAQIRDKTDKVWQAGSLVGVEVISPENESDVYQHHLRYTSHGRRRNARMRR